MKAVECIFFCTHHSKQYDDAICLNQLTNKYAINDVTRVVAHQGFDLRYIEVGKDKVNDITA